MKILSLIFLFSVLTTLRLADCRRKHSRHEKKNDWDALENLLKRIDRVGGERAARMEDEETRAPDVPLHQNTVPAEPGVKKNPCDSHPCGWGKDCIIGHDQKPKCDCIKRCPDNPVPASFDKVCSNTNETFESMCHLYRERCLCRRDDAMCTSPSYKHVHVEYMGSCKELEACTQSRLEHFAERMVDWLFEVMRDMKKRDELHGEEWERMVEEAEHDDHLKHVYPIVWKFCDLDTKPHDKAVSHHELISIIAPVMPMESCIKPFLKSCDSDDDGKISLMEWGKCLGLRDEEITERC